jgi:predicted dehydrogenase
MQVVAVYERVNTRREETASALGAVSYERSAGVYMFAENYPYIPFAKEMRRRYQAGDIGEVRYAEAEYLDEPADLASMVDDPAHWRARTPPPTTAPTPWPRSPPSPGPGRSSERLCGAHRGRPRGVGAGRRGRGWAALLVVRLDNGVVFKSLHGFLEGSQQAWMRIHGDRGVMENLRHGDTRTLQVVWDAKDSEDWRRAEEVFLPWRPGFPPSDADPMGDSSVAETLMLRDFASAVRHGTAPDQGVYFGVELRSLASRRCAPAWPAASRSMSPDLRRPDIRRAHAADEWFPDLPEL